MTGVSGIEYNGVDLRTYGLYANGNKVFSSPEKDYDVIPIPGRSGDIFIWKGTYKNVKVSYSVILLPTPLAGEDFETKFRENASDIRNVLLSPNGYVNIEDTYNPDEFRLGVFQGPLDIDAILLSAGKATLTFNCRPERFLNSGLVSYKASYYDGNLILNNPTPYPSRPMIALDNQYTEREITVTHNNEITSKFRVSGLNGRYSDGYFVFVDSDSFNTFRGDMQAVDEGEGEFSYDYSTIEKIKDANSLISFFDDYDYPILYPGDNVFTFYNTSGDGNASSAVSIVAFTRWYKL